jgi:RecA/RadA recombinase
LDSLEETIIENNVKLIVVDSIASVARKVCAPTQRLTLSYHSLSRSAFLSNHTQDFDDGGVMRRQAQLAAQASTLKRLAENFNIPVLVSNQVTTTSQRPYYEFDRPHFGGGTSYVDPPFSLRDS